MSFENEQKLLAAVMIEPDYIDMLRNQGVRAELFESPTHRRIFEAAEKQYRVSGTVELTEEQWTAFCDLVDGGIASTREESLDDGDAGPWLFIYWRGGEEESREFRFATAGTVMAFEAFCAGLKDAQPLPVSDPGNE